MPPRQPYNLHIKAPYNQNGEANALINIKGPWVIKIPQSETAKLTINILACKVKL